MSTETQTQPAESKKEHRFPCKKCGADLLFAAGQSEMQCPYCGHEEKIPLTAEAIKEYSFNDYLARPKSHGYGAVPGNRQELRCRACGAATQSDTNVRATVCPFCNAPLITVDKPEEVITPEAILPFKISAEQAQAAFKAWMRSRWFAPSSLQRESNLKKLQGVYRPFWTYDSHTVSHWTGERGTHYWVTETYSAMENGKYVTKTRQVRHTRWTSVSGVYSEFFDDVLVRAGKDSDWETNFDLTGLKSYSPEYLSGFGAEHYTVPCESGWQSAKNMIRDELQSAVRGEIGGDEQRIHSIDTAYSGVTYKHILLPMWISCYKYGAKTYCFQVNGQNGEVVGQRPYSFWKILRLILIIGAIVGVIAVIANS